MAAVANIPGARPGSAHPTNIPGARPGAAQATNLGRPKPPPAAGGHGAPHAPAKTQGTAGHWVNQAGKWQLIHAVGPGQWKVGTKPGFSAPPKPKQSFTVQSPTQPPDPATGGHYAKVAGGRYQLIHAVGPGKWAPGPAAANSGNSNGGWLSPLSPNQVTQQATTQVGAVYKPALDDLNSQTTQEQAIWGKQQSDNQYYLNWVDQKSNALNAQQAAVDQSTSALEQQLTGNATTVLGAETGGLTAAANATDGNVSNNGAAFAQGSPLGNVLAASEQGATTTENAAATRALGQEQTAQAQLGGATTNAGAQVQAGEARESAAFQGTMSKIASARSADLAKEEGALTSEITRLQSQQIAVAENNRNYQAATAKIGISAANTNSQIQQRAANTKIAAGHLKVAATNAATAAKRLGQTIAQDSIKNNLSQQGLNIRDKQLQIDQQKLVLSTLNTDSAVALRNAEIWAKQHPAAKGGSVLTPHMQNTYFDSIDSGSGEINSLMQSNGLTPNEAYQSVLRGYFTVKGSNGATKKVSIPRMRNQSLLNASFNLRQGGPGLNAGDIGYLNRMHLPTPAIHARYNGRIAGQSRGTPAPGNIGPVGHG